MTAKLTSAPGVMVDGFAAAVLPSPDPSMPGISRPELEWQVARSRQREEPHSACVDGRCLTSAATGTRPECLLGQCQTAAGRERRRSAPVAPAPHRPERRATCALIAVCVFGEIS